MKSGYDVATYAEAFDAHNEFTGAVHPEGLAAEFRGICYDADEEIAGLKARVENAEEHVKILGMGLAWLADNAKWLTSEDVTRRATAVLSKVFLGLGGTEPAEPLPPAESILGRRGLEALAAYADDEDRYNRVQGEAYGSIPTEAGAVARMARRMVREGQPVSGVETAIRDAACSGVGLLMYVPPAVVFDRETGSVAPVESEREKRLEEALESAARSLETVSTMAGRDEYLQNFVQVRGYAANRALVSRAALAREGVEV